MTTGDTCAHVDLVLAQLRAQERVDGEVTTVVLFSAISKHVGKDTDHFALLAGKCESHGCFFVRHLRAAAEVDVLA
jgi:hypothetical protein